jgi:hypothetical protein
MMVLLQANTEAVRRKPFLQHYSDALFIVILPFASLYTIQLQKRRFITKESINIL